MTIRSQQMNDCLQSYCSQLAEALNDRGLDMRKVFAVKTVDVPWTGNSVREFLYNPIAVAMFGNTSSGISNGETLEAFDVLNRHTINNFSIAMAWPTHDNSGEC